MRYLLTAAALAFLVFSPAMSSAELLSVLIEGDVVMDIAVQEEMIWLATDNGVLRFNRSTGDTLRFTEEDGLYSNRVCSILADNGGTIWAGTVEGINVFNGETFEKTAKRGLAFTLFLDSKGTIWAGGDRLSGGDLIDENYRTGSFYLAHFDGEYWRSDYVEADLLYGFCEYEGTYFYAGGLSGVYQYDGVTCTKLFAGDILMDVAITDDGTLYAVNYNNLFRWKDGKLEPVASGEFIFLHVAQDNTIWGGSRNLFKYDGENVVCYDLPEDVSLNCIEESDHGTLYLGTGTSLMEFSEETISVETEQAPAAFSLTGIYPNPFNPATTIEFTLDSPAFTELEIFNIAGQYVATLISDQLGAGSHAVTWNGSSDTGENLSSGVYIVRLSHGGMTENRSITLIR